MLAFLYGAESLETRLTRFLDWAKVKPIPGEKKKTGFSPQVASYFLAMLNPRQYPYYKPIVYKSAVTALLGKEALKRDPVERIFHCRKRHGCQAYTVDSLFLSIQMPNHVVAPDELVNGVLCSHIR